VEDTTQAILQGREVVWLWIGWALCSSSRVKKRHRREGK